MSYTLRLNSTENKYIIRTATVTMTAFDNTPLANGFHKDDEKRLEAERDVEKDKKKDEEDAGGEDRESWTGKLDFLMSALSFAVGLGNVWRFPYQCYRNGGGAFLIPYLITMFLAGFPLVFLEMAFGQYGRLGVVSIWKSVPIFQGIGWGMFAVSLVSCIYYNMIIAWCFFYVFASFRADVPWKTCDNWWNTEACSIVDRTEENNCTTLNGTWYNKTCHFSYAMAPEAYNQILNFTNYTSYIKKISPSDEYFHRYVLDISEGLHDLGAPRWQLVLCLLLCWLLVVFGLIFGVKSLGKATYVTSTFPYILLVILLIRGVTLEGSLEGIIYYVRPDFSQLTKAKVWGDAAVQVFFSLSCCWGGLITLASYNKFNNNCLRDAIFVAAGDCLTSIFGGFVIFSIIGYMAKELGVGIDEVAKAGAGLAFVVYPQAVTRLPVSPLWAILFMLVLINLGIGTQFTLVTTVHTTLIDHFPRIFKRGKRATFLLLGLCAGCFLLGLFMTTRGGMYILQIMDTYAPSYILLTVGVCETIAIGWLYGTDRFYRDMEHMMGKKLSPIWGILWKFITPGLIIFILVFTFVDFKRSSYGDYTFPVYADVIGWLISITEIMCIPAIALYRIISKSSRESKGFLQSARELCRPEADWGSYAQNLKVDGHLTVPLTNHTQNGVHNTDIPPPVELQPLNREEKI